MPRSFLGSRMRMKVLSIPSDQASILRVLLQWGVCISISMVVWLESCR